MIIRQNSSDNARSYWKRQVGVAMLIFLTIIVMGGAFAFVSLLNMANLQIGRDQITANALQQARDALIGWSVSRGYGATDRPGELPCPDTTNSGSAASTCSAGAIGRLPWKTLGIEEPKDSSGETLWYAIDGAFRNRNSNTQPINSDTRASMKVYDSDGTTLLTPSGYEAVAVIFAPGAPLSGQNRGTVAQQTTAANYLDVKGSFNNATTNGPFLQGTAKSTQVNDQLLVLTVHDFMPAVEKRVATEVRTMLATYYAANSYYPYPAKYNASSCLNTGPTGYLSNNCQSDTTKCRGRFPTDKALTKDWGLSGVTIPGWFYYNLWGEVIYYAVGTNYLKTSTAGCSTTLTVDGTSGVRGLFFLPGTPLGSIIRNSPTESTTLSNYLEDSANQDGWTGSAPSADSYVTPTGASNDRLQTLP